MKTPPKQATNTKGQTSDPTKSSVPSDQTFKAGEAQTTKDLDLSLNFILDQVLTIEQLMISIIYHFEAVDQEKTEGWSADVDDLMKIVSKFKSLSRADQDNMKIFTEFK